MIKAPFTCEEGELQGAVETMPLFTFSIDEANSITNNELREHGGALVSGVDDTYLIGPPKVVVDCMLAHRERLSRIAGLKLNLGKT